MTLEMRIRRGRSKEPEFNPRSFLVRRSRNPPAELAAAMMALQEAAPGIYAVLYGQKPDSNEFHTCMLPNDELLEGRASKLFSGKVTKHTYDDTVGLIKTSYDSGV